MTAAAVAALLVGEDTSSSATPAVTAPMVAGTTVTARDWDDMVEWRRNIGFVDGLGMSHTEVLGKTGAEDRLMNEELAHCVPREGNQQCALVLLRGYTGSPTMQHASYPVGLHWASWNAMMRAPPSMTDLPVEGTANVDS